MNGYLKPVPVKKKFFTTGVIVLCILALNGLIFLAMRFFFGIGSITNRSEEHTSELQSRPHLVCRLLLEKKKRLLTRVVQPSPPFFSPAPTFQPLPYLRSPPLPSHIPSHPSMRTRLVLVCSPMSDKTPPL